MRRGLLGGTFDPIHEGHLDVARAARDRLRLDEVWLVPSHVPPHRQRPHASAADRLAMTERAAAGERALVASDLELQSGGPSYTSATLDRLTARGFDTRAMFFITGADAFREIPTWKDFPAILDRCHFVAVSRPGCSASSLRSSLPGLSSRMIDDSAATIPLHPAIILVNAPTAPVSSTEIRRRIAADEPIDGLVPAAVVAYIEEHRLYR